MANRLRLNKKYSTLKKVDPFTFQGKRHFKEMSKAFSFKGKNNLNNAFKLAHK